MHQYSAKILNIVDGDTVDMEIDLGFEVTTHQRIRLYGINAAEKNTQDGRDARQFVVSWASVHGPVFTLDTVQTPHGSDAREKYGRYLGTISAASASDSLNSALVIAGLAKPYDGHGPRP
ncbi:thermonuclease family protein [Streptomyces sp. NPDC058268]|jgi:micrococcal nuclease|uniref:thermonuclease family protein n=1 Tax=Streptomyces sp. NPDC058268 TaxID=3346413 RepID=UPI0036E1DA2F